jgi:hypothetical protein
MDGEDSDGETGACPPIANHHSEWGVRGAYLKEDFVPIKMYYEGQPCRDCGTPVKLIKRRKEKVKTVGKWVFPSYLFCIKCRKHYTVNSEKKLLLNRKEK